MEYLHPCFRPRVFTNTTTTTTIIVTIIITVVVIGDSRSLVGNRLEGSRRGKDHDGTGGIRAAMDDHGLIPRSPQPLLL